MAKIILPFLLSGTLSWAQSPTTTGTPTPAQNSGFAQSVGGLAQDLMAKSHEGENILVSPLSIETALAMASVGARGPTLTEMQQVLHLNAAVDAKDTLKKLDESKNYVLKMANRIWLNNEHEYLPEFSATLQESIAASFERLDFKHKAEGSRLNINKWVAEQTNDKIKDLLPMGSITPASEMVLTNAVYFLGSWQHPFPESATKDADFHQFDGSVATVSMMRFVERYPYFADEGGQVLELPYAGGSQMGLIVFLPKQGNSALKYFSTNRLQDFLSKGHAQKVIFGMPKFRLETSIELSESMKELGMLKAFSLKEADFSGIRKLDPKSHIAISKIFHKTYLDLNEKGTEAAAATAVSMIFATSASTAAPPVMIMDHPFAFALYHHGTGSIVFSGVYGKVQTQRTN